MVEFILLFIFFYLVFNSFSKRKAKRKPRTLDAELKHLIQDSSDSTAISLAKPTESPGPRFHALSDFERLFQKSCGGCHMLIQVTGQGEGV